MGKHERTTLDKARDELFSHINRCGVLQFIEERYPDLNSTEMKQLEQLGLRYCRPVIRHGKANTATSEWKEEATA